MTDTTVEARLLAALGLDGKMAKRATSLRDVLALAQVEAARRVLKCDPFARIEGTLAGQLLDRLAGPRPDLAALPWPDAIQEIEATYPQWLGDTIERMGERPAADSAQAELAKRAQALRARDPDLTEAGAVDRVLESDGELAGRVLAEEG